MCLESNLLLRPLTIVTAKIEPRNPENSSRQLKIQVSSKATPIFLEATEGSIFNFIKKSTAKIKIETPEGMQKIDVSIKNIVEKLHLTPQEIHTAINEGTLESLLILKATTLEEQAQKLAQETEVSNNYHRIHAEMLFMNLNPTFQQQITSHLMQVINYAVHAFHHSGTMTCEEEHEIDEERKTKTKFHATYNPEVPPNETIQVIVVRTLGMGSFGQIFHTADLHTKEQRVEKESCLNYNWLASMVNSHIDDMQIVELLVSFQENPTQETHQNCLAGLENLVSKGNAEAIPILCFLKLYSHKPQKDLQLEWRNLQKLNSEGKVWGIQELPIERTVRQIIPSPQSNAIGKMIIPVFLYDGDYADYLDLLGTADMIDKDDITKCLYEAFQLVAGLAYAHSVGLIHGDIKPENVFLKKSAAATKNGVPLVDVVIADWGGARQVGVDASGPCSFSEYYSTQADITLCQQPANINQQPLDLYSLGKTISTRILGAEENTMTSLNMILEREFPQKFVELLGLMMKEDPATRPDALTILIKLDAIVKETDPELAEIIHQQLAAQSATKVYRIMGLRACS